MPIEGFNALERAVIDWLIRHYQDDKLTAQIKAATFHYREWTGVGFYTYLNADYDQARLDMMTVGGSWPIHGPSIQSSGIADGGGVVFWGSDGYIDCIEMFSFGSAFAREIEDFRLITD